jgi:hypothetical protein
VGSGYRNSVSKRVKSHYEAEVYKVLAVRIEDGVIYVECDGMAFKESLDDWM